MNCRLPGSSVHGISQARILEWVAISSSRDLPNSGIKPLSPALAGRFFTTEPLGYGGLLIQTDWCPYEKGKFGHRHATWRWRQIRWGSPSQEPPRMSANPQKLEESVRPILPDRLRRNQPCSYLDSGLPASRAKTIHFHCLNHSVCGITGSLRKKTHGLNPCLQCLPTWSLDLPCGWWKAPPVTSCLGRWWVSVPAAGPACSDPMLDQLKHNPWASDAVICSYKWVQGTAKFENL